MRVRLSDNGNGVLGDVLDGGSLALGVQTNIIGGRRSAPSAVERPPAGVGSRGQTVGVLAAVVVGCLVLGALATFCAARLRRRAS